MESGRTSRGGGGGGGSEERSFKAPLHNFNLPSFLKWGHQRHLRCIKLPDDDGPNASVFPAGLNKGSTGNERAGGDRSRRNRSPPTKRPSGIRGDDGIEAVREKIMLDLKNAAARMKDAIFRKETAAVAPYSSSSEEEEEEEEEEQDLTVAEKEEKEDTEEVRRWNLRTRRGSAVLGKGVSPAPVVVAGVATGVGGGGRRVVVVGGGGGGGHYNSSPTKTGENGEEEKKREKFSVALKRKEIEEDFMVMLGHRPARRPKKRPRNVQRQLDTLFPGLWLMEVTVDTYKVPECPDNGKR